MNMKGATPEMVALLQRKKSNIRNICILAHVDHGKTTLADALVASNGIISQRMAGKLRYMDSREDEQIRGITMKSSAISLLYHLRSEEYLINLIDSPGHVDFSSEVSTAVRLCEGAVVVVDVVEGVCPQTHAVLRQAYLENITPVLVLNKVDRLISELKMEPQEAYYHLQQTLIQVNLVTSELFTSDAMEKNSNLVDEDGKSDVQSHDWTNIEDSEETRKIYFTPDQGNVVFASAYDGWGFTITHFADLYSMKLGISKDVLQKTLWGDYYLNSKTKRIMNGAQSKGKKPLFVQFVLENIWSVYESVHRRDKDRIEKIITSLGLKLTARDLRHNDPKVQLQAICNQWLPVSSAVLRVVVEKLPSPLELTEDKVEKLMSSTRRFESLLPETQALKTSFLNCSSSEESPVIIFVSKMFPVDKRMLPNNRQRPLTEAEIQERRRQVREKLAERNAAKTKEDTLLTEEKDNTTTAKAVLSNDKEIKVEEEEENTFIAFARVFSGTVKRGQKLYVLGPKHDPASALRQNDQKKLDDNLTVSTLDSEHHVTAVTVTDMYLFMGRELEYMDAVPAGNILGLGGLEDHILKSGTISSTLTCTPFCDLYLDVAPIVRVALEPKHAAGMQKLIKGLKLLNQADPCVQVLIQETGEHVIVTAGEVHLQRCIDDLKDRYAKVDLNVSEPIVPFRETIIPPPKVDMVNEAIQDQNSGIKNLRLKDIEEDEEVLEAGLIETYTLNQRCCLRIRALPLPEQVTCLLEQHQELLKMLEVISAPKFSEKTNSNVDLIKQESLKALKDLKENLDKEFIAAGKIWKNAVNEIWCLGPRRVGPNVLLNRVEGYDRPNVWSCLEAEISSSLKVRQYDNSIVSGFQIATLAGPICEEPMRGVCYIIEKWSYIRSSESISYDTDIVKVDTTHSISEHPKVDETVQNDDKDLDLKGNPSDKSVQFEDQNSSCDSSDSEENEFDCEKTLKNAVKSKKQREGPMSGQLIYCMKEGCRKAFQTQPQRLVVAMYKCSIQATSEVLGKLCAVLGQRNGHVLEDDMREGSQMFNIVAALPVIESFGFAESIRKKTSGLASPQLVFSHWEVVDIDPYWTPTTEEELTHYGEKADSANRARVYMNKVRKRKGLKVDEKIVEHAEKQRTLTKMK